MTTNEWIDNIKSANLICDKYLQRLNFVTSRRDIYRIICDPNGLTFFAELIDKGILVPFNVFKKEYANFVNGKNIVTYESGATSKMYIGYNDTLTADTTFVGVYDSDCEIIVPSNKYPKIVIGSNTKAHIVMTLGARATLDVHNSATYTISGDQTKIKISKK